MWVKNSIFVYEGNDNNNGWWVGYIKYRKISFDYWIFNNMDSSIVANLFLLHYFLLLLSYPR
jgi:beta-lactamase class D